MSYHLYTRRIVGGIAMWKDPVVQEVRKIREARAAKLNYDIRAIVEDARERQQRSKQHVISFKVKRGTDTFFYSFFLGPSQLYAPHEWF